MIYAAIAKKWGVKKSPRLLKWALNAIKIFTPTVRI
jgi:hypothetical protein